MREVVFYVKVSSPFKNRDWGLIVRSDHSNETLKDTFLQRLESWKPWNAGFVNKATLQNQKDSRIWLNLSGITFHKGN